MRHGNSRRSRGGRGPSRKSNAQKSQVYDSNGPDVRIRGTAHQVTEKYLALAKDAEASGDKILAESYFQFAEHYQRIINSWNVERENNQGSDQGDSNEAKEKNGQPKHGQKQASAKNDDLGLPSSILTPTNLQDDSGDAEKKQTVEGDA